MKVVAIDLAGNESAPQTLDVADGGSGGLSRRRARAATEAGKRSPGCCWPWSGSRAGDRAPRSARRLVAIAEQPRSLAGLIVAHGVVDAGQPRDRGDDP